MRTRPRIRGLQSSDLTTPMPMLRCYRYRHPSYPIGPLFISCSSLPSLSFRFHSSPSMVCPPSIVMLSFLATCRRSTTRVEIHRHTSCCCTAAVPRSQPASQQDRL